MAEVALARQASADYYEQCVEFSATIWEARDALLFRMHGAGARHALIAKELGMSVRGVEHAVARLRRRMMGS
jgi:hypothetical protein